MLGSQAVDRRVLVATHCTVHEVPLAPHAASAVKIADKETVFDLPNDSLEAWDSLCQMARFDDWAMLRRVAQAKRRRQGGHAELLKLRFAVRDVIDGLGTLTHDSHPSALMNEFERPMFGRRSLVGAMRLPMGWFAEMDAVTRLLYVRMALLILAEPRDPDSADDKSFSADWMLDLYAHSKPSGWQRLFEHAARDLLVIFTARLPRHAILELGERTTAWPEDLRRRWTYAATAGALGGYVF